MDQRLGYKATEIVRVQNLCGYERTKYQYFGSPHNPSMFKSKFNVGTRVSIHCDVYIVHGTVGED